MTIFLLYTLYKIVRIGKELSNKVKDGIWRKWVTCAEAAGRNAVHLSLSAIAAQWLGVTSDILLNQ